MAEKNNSTAQAIHQKQLVDADQRIGGSGQHTLINGFEPKRKQPFSLRVCGDSMENPGGKHSYSDGDMICIDPERSYGNGSRVIARLDGNKRPIFGQLVTGGDKRYLKAINPAWTEKMIELNGNTTICGVVIGKWCDE